MICGRNNEHGTRPRSAHVTRNGQRAPNVTDGTVETQFTNKDPVLDCPWFQLPGGDEDAERNRQVKCSPFFSNVGRSKLGESVNSTERQFAIPARGRGIKIEGAA